MTATITTRELAEAAHTTIRKIQLWTRARVIDPTTNPNPGGNARYHPNLIPIATTLEQISRALGGYAPHALLARIADHHADGVLEIAPGIVLVWEPPPPLEQLLTDEQADRLLAAIRTFSSAGLTLEEANRRAMDTPT